MKNRTFVCLYTWITPRQSESLDKLAKASGRSKADIVRSALDVAIQEGRKELLLPAEEEETDANLGS